MGRKKNGTPFDPENPAVFFRFPSTEALRIALERACSSEYLSMGAFGCQAVHNELVRRGYLDAPIIGAERKRRGKFKENAVSYDQESHVDVDQLLADVEDVRRAIEDEHKPLEDLGEAPF